MRKLNWPWHNEWPNDWPMDQWIDFGPPPSRLRRFWNWIRRAQTTGKEPG